jgi:hypothetical protein
MKSRRNEEAQAHIGLSSHRKKKEGYGGGSSIRDEICISVEEMN